MKQSWFNRSISVVADSPVKQDRTALTFFICVIDSVGSLSMSGMKRGSSLYFICATIVLLKKVGIHAHMARPVDQRKRSGKWTRPGWGQRFLQHLCVAWFGHCYPTRFFFFGTGTWKNYLGEPVFWTTWNLSFNKQREQLMVWVIQELGLIPWL